MGCHTLPSLQPSQPTRCQPTLPLHLHLRQPVQMADGDAFKQQQLEDLQSAHSAATT
jgi:hypothetical protein